MKFKLIIVRIGKYLRGSNYLRGALVKFKLLDGLGFGLIKNLSQKSPYKIRISSYKYVLRLRGFGERER